MPARLKEQWLCEPKNKTLKIRVVQRPDVRSPLRTFTEWHVVHHSTRRSALADGMADGHSDR
jgi:hypothetical protein